MMRRFAIGLSLLLGARAACAAPPPDANPAWTPWFNDLRHPWTNALCCSVADCRPAQSRIQGDHFEAFIAGDWRAVPDNTVIERRDNPTGSAVACWTPSAGVTCFVPPPES